ncbi:MAG: aminodeoxychorismate/anthranilate synthase component II [Chloroflexota bacterium]|nr:aminodeoxychorismate/anthranilate synthase component II [Chloroflexota bacterium]
MAVLLIDNYDSFTYNLAHTFGTVGVEVVVQRNDEITVAEVQAMDPSHIVISPGPGTPDDGGISLEVIRTFAGEKPILGVCLGHQCIGAALGGTVTRAPRLMHGKTSPVHHDQRGIFRDIPSPFNATRYHSLIVQEPLPEALEMTAFTVEGEVMAIRHRHYPIFGVQFHPESILTEYGQEIVRNFLTLSRSGRSPTPQSPAAVEQNREEPRDGSP